jgi:Fe-S-cluster containining protein
MGRAATALDARIEPMASNDTQWYSKGLQFKCTSCGHCCRIEGHVWVGLGEVRTMARQLGIGLEAFGRRFLRRVGSRFSLIDNPNGDCIFWENGCSIYDSRPRQCRTFPFWNQNLESPTAWKQAARECEGIGEGRLYQLAEIESLRNGRGETFAGKTPAAGCGTSGECCAPEDSS